MKKNLCAKNPSIHPNSDIILIAQWFVEKADMSHKKIQKLCFYSEVWSLLTLGVDIVPDARFEAWVHGPVCPKLYEELKRFGWRDIMIAEKFKELVKNDLNTQLSDDQKKILQFVWESYGELTADELEGLTHSEDPWKIARGNRDTFEPCNQEITRESMIEYYSKRYEEYI